jgi:hypothetical protein
MNIDNEDAVFAREYDLSFPEGEEYAKWIASIESDSKLAVTNRTRFFYDSQDLSPYSTINS